MPRLLSIGDIHGCAAAFETLIDFADIGGDDTLVTLGDYVNRGRDSKGVIELLLELQGCCNLVALRGNHEVMMLWAGESDTAFEGWLVHGGDTTMASYAATSLHDIPESHWAFLRATQPFHETGEFIFVHGNVDPHLPLRQQTDENLFWTKLTGNVRHDSGKLIVCGHTPQKSGFPLKLEDVVCIDTDAKNGGWLTCLEPSTGRYWQASESGATRTGHLDAP